jgi:purine-binding chemotaxis protein CheW
VGRLFVSFFLGSAGYCVPVDNVLQIFRQQSILPAPRAEHFVKGVISLRGEVIPVVDLRARLGLPEEGGRRKSRIVVVQFGKRAYGLLVDEVREVLELEEESLDPERVTLPGVSPALLCGAARRADSVFFILDLEGIFAGGRAAVISSGEHGGEELSAQ